MNQHKRGQSLAGFRNESHGLAKDNRRNLLTTSMDDSQHSAISARLGKVSVGAPPAKSTGRSTGMEDLLTSDREKHDYDWLLTPPGTPLGDKQASLLAQIPVPVTRPTSATKTSKISTSHSDVSVPAKPTRSTPTTRPSTALSGSPKSVLSISSMSVNSRPSTPNRRSPATSQSRPATPSRTKPAPASSRPSTPTSRAHIPSVAKPAPVKPTSPAVTRTASRPSTPTRRAPTETPVRSPSPTVRSPATTTVRSPATTTRSTATASHARSPSPKPHIRQPLAIPDFPTEAPPNLRTTAAERQSSAARSRPSSSHGTRSTEIAAKEGPTARRPSPARGREHSTRDHVLANGHSENNQTSTRIPASRPMSSSGDNGGFGRTISKKSMDMALRHMDIRHSSGNIRPLAGSSLFPQSIRPNTFKIRLTSQPDTQVSSRMSNGKISENEHAMKVSDHENSKERSQIVDLITERLTEKLKEAEKMREAEISISTRYDAFLLKEDLKNTEWLHSLNDQSPIFDQRFEQLPEPFSFT